MINIFGVGNGFEIILASLGVIILLVGSFTDFKTHEVPDWVSYSFIAAAIGSRIIYSAAYSDWLVLVKGIAGFAVFFGFGILLFYTGQWGGGDSKVLMGIGALIGISFTFDSGLLAFIVNALFLGALYGIVFSIFLAANNWSSFKKKHSELCNKMRSARLVSILFALIFLAAFFWLPSDIKMPFLLLSILCAISAEILFFAKAVETGCMLKRVPPEKLTEGDWIAKEIKYEKKYLAGPKDLGISKKQIRQLVQLHRRGKIKSVLIKVGIPFVPAFLLGFIAALVWGNLFLQIIGMW